MTFWPRANPTQQVYFSAGVIVVAAGIGTWLLAPVLVPMLASMSLYALLEPAASRLERRGVRRGIAVQLLLLLVVLGGGISLALLAPTLFDQLTRLQHQLPLVLEALNLRVQELVAAAAEVIGLALASSNFVDLLADHSSDLTTDFLLGASGGFARLTIVLLLVPLFTYFLLVDYRRLRNRAMSWVSNENFELAWLIYYRVARQLQRYIRGVLTQSLIMAAISGCGFAVVGLDMWVLLGTLTGLLNLIPYVGPLMALAVVAVAAIAQSGAELSLLIGAVGIIVLAQLIDNVLVIPAVVAEAADLHPLAVIIGVIVFGNLFGFVGMVLAVPSLAALRITVTELRHGLRSSATPMPVPA